MSASLVGSEMCIRDRPGSAARGGLRLLPIRGRGEGHLALWACWDHCPPVSYTHLTLPTICSV
eukprot:9296452-Alexandrium_andersonii.AAC.1